MLEQRRIIAAIRKGQVDEVRRLLPELTSIDARDRDGNCLLHHAASSGNGDFVKMLLDAGADVDARGYLRATPLMRATSMEAGQVLIDRGADLTAKDDAGMTPLMCAANLDVPELVKRLIDRGAELEARSAVGATALIYAVYTRASSNEEPSPGDVVDVLLTAGADVNGKDKEGKSPLAIALECEGQAYAEYLRSRGAT
jgi:ankyrin repeat protein